MQARREARHAHEASLVGGSHRSLHEVQHVITIHRPLQHCHDFQRDGMRRDGRRPRAGHQQCGDRHSSQLKLFCEFAARMAGIC